MNILIDIGHPGHVHLFRPFAKEMIDRGHKVLFTCRQKEYEIELLKAFGFEYQIIGPHHQKLYQKILGLYVYSHKIIKISKKFKPDVFLSHGSIIASFSAWYIGKPHISLEDTGNKEQVMLYKPFTKYILTPSVFPDLYKKKQIKFEGYNELAYLNPKYFMPDDSIYELLEIPKSKKYAIIRFVSWRATHDINKRGLSFDFAKKIIYNLEERDFKIFITSEKILPMELRKYAIKIPIHKFHDALYFADLVLGDSQTIIAEAGILGTPAIRFNELVGTAHGFHHKEMEETYNLIYNIHVDDELKLIDTLKFILELKNRKKVWKDRVDKLFSDKENVTEFIIRIVNNTIKNLNQ